MRADTKIFGCIADPIDHVKAPTMFTNEFIQRNINAVMIPINVKKDNLKEVLNGLKIINNFCGLTVTIPHKVEVLKYCDHLYDEAQETQAVNWIKFKNKKIVGNNFDGLGNYSHIEVKDNIISSDQMAHRCRHRRRRLFRSTLLIRLPKSHIHIQTVWVFLRIGL